MPHFIGMARRFGKKVILHEHAADFKEFYEASADKQSIISTLRSVDLLIALSESWKQYFASIGMPPGKIEVLKILWPRAKRKRKDSPPPS